MKRQALAATTIIVALTAAMLFAGVASAKQPTTATAQDRGDHNWGGNPGWGGHPGWGGYPGYGHWWGRPGWGHWWGGYQHWR